MKQVFDFNNVYAGTAVINGKAYSCTLSFPEHHMLFKVIADDLDPLKMGNAFEFHGYVSTELGIMNYRARNAWQSGYFDNYTTFSRQEFIANSLIVTHEQNDLSLEDFGQVNICYHQLEAVGDFITVEDSNWEKMKFNFSRLFEQMAFLETDQTRLVLENYVTYNFTREGPRYFTLNLEPYFCFQPGEGFSLADSGTFVKGLGWFIELIFGIRQYPTDVLFFKDVIGEHNVNGQKPYYYLNRELIANKSRIRKAMIPVFKLNDLQAQLPGLFEKWHRIPSKQRILFNLYFNGIHSESTASDDKFKNFCAIVQGLEALGTTVSVGVVKGEMNKKLRKATEPVFESVMVKYLKLEALHKLYELIGEQRDFYQHLSKNITYDLNDAPGGLWAINAILKVIIKSHSLKYLGLDGAYIAKILEQDLAMQAKNLRQLATEIQVRYNIS